MYCSCDFNDIVEEISLNTVLTSRCEGFESLRVIDVIPYRCAYLYIAFHRYKLFPNDILKTNVLSLYFKLEINLNVEPLGK